MHRFAANFTARGLFESKTSGVTSLLFGAFYVLIHRSVLFLDPTRWMTDADLSSRSLSEGETEESGIDREKRQG
ncbi:MAG TPA: hypothetical protein VMS12_03075 [Thermoanaerobaculia bacterium]|nr:hypothetical protein [Thermoanaerobaculia bacterium]